MWILIAVLTTAGVADATDRGRIVGTVVDPDGQPIEGVLVTATCDEVSRFEESDTTNRKGVFKIDFDYLGVVYTLRFEKDGYFPLESKQDWDLEGTARQEFVLQPGEPKVVDVPVASASNQAVTSFNQGVAAFNADDFETAEARFREALEHDSELHQAWSGLSQIYLQQERFEDAVTAAEQAIELGATDESVWRIRWEAYRALGDEEKTKQALLDLENAEIRAEEAKRIHNEGVHLADSGDHQAAFAKFTEALELDPNLLPALLGAATSGLEIGKNSEAIDAARRILNADPSDEAAIRIQYNAALGLGDADKIVDALVDLAKVEPETARDGLLTLAFEAYDASDMDTAVTRFEKVLQVDPSAANCHYYLGLIHMNNGATDKAKAHLQQFVIMAPEHPEAATAQQLLDYINQG